ncbi:MAG: high-affinity nickel-transport family protein [Pseudomonadota bacterium]
MGSLGSMLALGFLLGLRHATDADHVAAVGAIASRERSVRGALLIGASWGFGHALTVLLVGSAIVLLGIVIPPRVGLGMEFSVALMLIGLGVLNLGGVSPAVCEGAPAATLPRAALLRALGVGIVHGLAGSAAVALLVLASTANSWIALPYLGLFGLGTVVGMTALTSILALSTAWAAERAVWLRRMVVRVAGLLSLSVGLVLAYRVGIVEGLFLAAR